MNNKSRTENIMSNINWNNPKLRKISQEKKHILMQLERDIDNMPSNNNFVYLMTIMSKLKRNGIKFNDDELELLHQVLTHNMTETDKKKLTLIQNLIKSHQ